MIDFYSVYAMVSQAFARVRFRGKQKPPLRAGVSCISGYYYLFVRLAMISAATFGGTSSYCESSIVEAARPWLIERISFV